MSLYSTLKEIYFSLDNGDRRLLEAFNLTVPRFYLLKHIAGNPGITLTQLSALMLTDKSNITRLIKSLEGEGLVYKQPHETDGRAFSLYLTSEGRRLVVEAADAHDRYTKERFLPIGTEANCLLDDLVAVKRLLEGQLV